MYLTLANTGNLFKYLLGKSNLEA